MNIRPQSSELVSVIVPVYGQAETIVSNLQHLLTALEGAPYPFEIIVVIDGMVDRSFSNIKRAQIPHVKSVAYPENQGKAYAIRLGMELAKGRYILFIDAGFEIDPQGISMLMMHMEWYNADVIVGSKRHQASVVNYTGFRRILSYGYYYLVRVLFGLRVRDTQAGIKMFRREVLESMLPRLVEKRFAGDLEMLAVAKKLGFSRIYEAPIKLNYQFSSVTSAATLNSIVLILRDTLSIWCRVYLTKFYHQDRFAFTWPDKLWEYPAGSFKLEQVGHET